MKKYLLLVMTLLLSLHASADCFDVYIKAAKKRQVRNNRIVYGAVIASVFISPIVAGIGLVGAIANDTEFDDSGKNTYGKVRRVLYGETHLITKKVAKYLKKHDVLIDSKSPEFRSGLAEIVNDMNNGNKFCPIKGYDENFNDKFIIFNLTNFSKLITIEYLARHQGITVEKI